MTALLTVVLLSALQVDPATLRVGPGGDFSTISAAVAAANIGDTVRVAPGTYTEPTLVLDKAVALIGEPGAIIDGEGERTLVHVLADSVTVAGFLFRNTGISFVEDRAAILIDKAQYCTVRDNVLEDTFFGIYLANSGDCDILRNTMAAQGTRETRSGNGIHLWYSVRVRIEGNRIRGHRDGIYFEFVEDSEVVDNDSRGNIRYGLCMAAVQYSWRRYWPTNFIGRSISLCRTQSGRSRLDCLSCRQLRSPTPVRRRNRCGPSQRILLPIIRHRPVLSRLTCCCWLWPAWRAPAIHRRCPISRS